MSASLLYFLKALLVLVFFVDKPVQEAEWKLVREANNIKVFTVDADNTALQKVKVEALVEGKWEKILPVFQDVANYDKWVFATERSSLIQIVSDREILYYIETDLPWPAKNRDAVLRMKIRESTAGEIIIDTIGEPNAGPVTEGNVRVPRFTDKWVFTKAGNSKLRITYYLAVDPGGSLPPWLINMFKAKAPLETISNLSDKLRR
ncbi:START domain-containing protein [Pontibacter ummariensis]|uniref:START domain-containing protein n=1 Tax=Pontibacter ummariensis TaxID=1610492 RepID=A0A239G532_9BACT|nr:START domain-containing protein [Pontibacter ummariensis]PRY11633.1 START domain-containing protein [Pontibacter ummariensis]SNS64267.1 START domain-containing protein [Pontibacter ummariensis]